ncbi:hypothetical protein BOX15_Mlig002762g3 [Macrostomum lignano]|uniref:SCP domain-containing protein n=2 Tax=Macrostomum lignano TaxID=282301 RepID=A0A1I8GCN7_9PLAT|nr:hypothetical protein BOX15_Mlig002762g3 [Macrostomum lignano]
MPSSSDDIRWPWESDEENSPRQSRTPQNSPNSGGGGGRQHSSYVMHSGARTSSRQMQHHQQNVGHHPVVLEHFVHEMLLAHNKYRAMHQAPPLKLDRSLTEGAQHWAETIASQDQLKPDMDVKNAHIGENLAMKFNSERTDFSGAQFTDYWYSGIADYDFGENAPRLHRGSGALSFTQMVWKASRMVGFGRAVSRLGRVYVVGRYFPGGNSIEGFVENVLPPLGANLHDVGRSSTMDRQHSEEHLERPSKMAAVRSASSRMSEYVEPPEGAIGAVKPSDTLVSSSTSTEYQNDRTVVIFEEKYRTADGSTYTKQKKTTYYGENRHHS